MTIHDLPKRDPRAVMDRSAVDVGHCRPTILHPRADAQLDPLDALPRLPCRWAELRGLCLVLGVVIGMWGIVAIVLILLGIAWEWIAQ